MLSERSTIWATSPLRKRGANAISNLPSVNAIVERSSFAYCSKIGFVDAGHQSMFFSHGNRLPFRLTCLAGGVQRSCLCHTDVFDSLISRMFPSTSFWGKPWRFAAPIAFSASSVLFQMFTFAYWTYVSISFFLVYKNSFTLFFFWFPGSSEKLEMRGIDCRTSCKLSERSTIWATTSLKKRGANAISNFSSVKAKVEQSFLLHIVVNMALSMRVINPCVSHMPIACPFNWHASLVGSKRAVYVRRMSLILLSVE